MLKLISGVAVLMVMASDPVPRVHFARTVPAPQNAGGAEKVTVLYRVGDSGAVNDFVEHFVEQANKSETVYATAVPQNEQHIVGDTPLDVPHATHIRRVHPADLYVGVKEFSCGFTERSGERSVHDADGKRVPQTYSWVEAMCQARIDLVSAATMARSSSFYVRGQGSSSRVEKAGDEERDAARRQATRSAAIYAAEQITPRQVRETIELDADAPDFDRGYALVEAGELAAARSFWEKTSARHKDSGALHYNLAALSEALGDLQAAGRYYDSARKLAPANSRFRLAAISFERRTKKAPPEGGAEAERRKPPVRPRSF